MAAGLIPKWRLVQVNTKTSSEESAETIKNKNPGVLVIENKYRYLYSDLFPLPNVPIWNRPSAAAVSCRSISIRPGVAGADLQTAPLLLIH